MRGSNSLQISERFKYHWQYLQWILLNQIKRQCCDNYHILLLLIISMAVLKKESVRV